MSDESQKNPAGSASAGENPAVKESAGRAGDAPAASSPGAQGFTLPGAPFMEYRLVPVQEWDDDEDDDEGEGSGKQVDFGAILSFLWAKRSLIAVFALAGALVGFVVETITPKEYTVTATLIPEAKPQSGGASGILSQIGLSRSSSGMGGSEIPVELYAEVSKTLPFQKKIMDQRIYIPDVDSVTSLYIYFSEIQKPAPLMVLRNWTIGLPAQLFAMLNNMVASMRADDADARPAPPSGTVAVDGAADGASASASSAVMSAAESPMATAAGTRSDSGLPDGVLKLTRREMGVASVLGSRILVALDDRTNIITLTVTMPYPEMSATVGQFVVDELTDYLTEYQIGKLKKDLAYTEERLVDARIRYESSMLALTEFQEGNQGSMTARARKGEQFLQQEYSLAAALYSNLMQQFEQQKLKIQEETPVFSLLNPVQLPYRPDRLPLSMTTIMTLVGVLVSIVFIYVRNKELRDLIS